MYEELACTRATARLTSRSTLPAPHALMTRCTPQPLIVLFCLMDNYPEAYERHYAFMLEGLVEVAANLRARGIRFAVVHGQAPVPIIAASLLSGCVVTDCGYTRLLRQWRRRLGQEVMVAVFEVEGEVVVPSKLLTDRHETVAATFRRRLTPLIKQYLVDVAQAPLRVSSLELDPLLVLGSNNTVLLDLDGGVEPVLGALNIDRSVPRVCAGGDAADEPLRGGARRNGISSASFPRPLTAPRSPQSRITPSNATMHASESKATSRPISISGTSPLSRSRSRRRHSLPRTRATSATLRCSGTSLSSDASLRCTLCSSTPQTTTHTCVCLCGPWLD